MIIRFFLILFLFLPFKVISDDSLNVGDSFDQYVQFMKKLNINIVSLENRSLLLQLSKKESALFLGANLGANRDENLLKTYGILYVSFNGPLDYVLEGEKRYITSICFRLYPKNKNIITAKKHFKSFPLDYENKILNQINEYEVKYYTVSTEAFNLFNKINKVEIKKGNYSMTDIVKISKDKFKDDVKYVFNTKMNMAKKIDIEDDNSLFDLLYEICLSQNLYLYISDKENIIIHDSKEKADKDLLALKTTIKINAIKDDFLLKAVQSNNSSDNTIRWKGCFEAKEVIAW